MTGILPDCSPEVLGAEEPRADPPEVADEGAGARLAISFSIHSCCLGENGFLPAPLLDPGRDDRVLTMYKCLSLSLLQQVKKDQEEPLRLFWPKFDIENIYNMIVNVR